MKRTRRGRRSWTAWAQAFGQLLPPLVSLHSRRKAQWGREPSRLRLLRAKEGNRVDACETAAVAVRELLGCRGRSEG